MNYTDWVEGFKTIYEGIWVGINKDVKQFRENKTSYVAELNSGKLYFINKTDAQKVQRYAERKGIELLFAVENHKGMNIELLMEFRYKEKSLRVLASYGLEGEEKINLYAWGPEDFPNKNEITKEVSDILLNREFTKDKKEQGSLSIEMEGIIDGRMLFL